MSGKKEVDQTVELGDEVKDKVSGYKGVVICISRWINGCRRVTAQARELKDGAPVHTLCEDIEQWEVLKKSAVKVTPPRTNGPMPAATRQANPTRG